MSASPEETPFSESNLESPEYRERLTRKLNCLIAVLEVAIGKVRRSLAGPDPDIDRLKRIQKNLSDTLEVCRRARRALERQESLPSELSSKLSDVTRHGVEDVAREAETRPSPGRKAAPGMAVEMTSPAELERFKNLDPIDAKAVRHVDLEELGRLLQGELE